MKTRGIHRKSKKASPKTGKPIKYGRQGWFTRPGFLQLMGKSNSILFSPSLPAILDYIAKQHGGDSESIRTSRSKLKQLAARIGHEHLHDLIALSGPALPFVLIANAPLVYYAWQTEGTTPAFVGWTAGLYFLNIILSIGVFLLLKFVPIWSYRFLVVYGAVPLFFAIYGFYIANYIPLWPLHAVLVVHMIVGGVLAITSAITAPVRYLFLLIVAGCMTPIVNAMLSYENKLVVGLAYLSIIYSGLLIAFNYYDHIRRKYETIVRLLFHETNDRVIQTHKNLETANRDIEQRYHNLRKIKEKQAGDYFLTSVLLEPLIGQTHTFPGLIVQGILRQHKRFRFRGRPSALGGDVNIAARVELAGGNYTLVVNGDAMGNGMHGAGGAIVFGTLVRSILFRAKRQPKSVGPVQWLHSVVHEINQVFYHFHGSMTVTYVICLVGVRSEPIYMVNCGHPHPVLYAPEASGSKVCFIRDFERLPEAGLGVIPATFAVHQLMLNNSNSLLIGSDGRDTILKKGASKIQLNPDDFLETVGQTGPDPLKIYRSLRKRGQITDDFSLIRLKRPRQ